MEILIIKNTSMKNIKRKIGFFYLTFHLNAHNERNNDIMNNLIQILSFITSKTKKFKKHDISDDRFCFLDAIEVIDDSSIIKILFKSAKHSYRAPLLNKNTVEERENPKTIEEGERFKTHLLIKAINGDALVFLETYRGGLTLKLITEYLNEYTLRYNRDHKRNKIEGYFSFDVVPRDDFSEVLNNMSRVVCASLYIEKQILGSEALNYSNITDNIQEDIIVEVKSKRGQSIKHTIYDFLAKLNGGKTEIKKMRVKGILPNNNESIIDTSFIIKKEYIDAQQNEDTGEINTPFLFSQLEELSNSFK